MGRAVTLSVRADLAAFRVDRRRFELLRFQSVGDGCLRDESFLREARLRFVIVGDTVRLCEVRGEVYCIELN